MSLFLSEVVYWVICFLGWGWGVFRIGCFFFVCVGVGGGFWGFYVWVRVLGVWLGVFCSFGRLEINGCC